MAHGCIGLGNSVVTRKPLMQLAWYVKHQKNQYISSATTKFKNSKKLWERKSSFYRGVDCREHLLFFVYI